MRKAIRERIRTQVLESYAAIAEEFDRTRQKPWEEFHHFLAYIRKGARVLDVGCGNGRLLNLLHGKGVEYTGIDPNSQLLELARKAHPGARFELQDMTALDFETGAFDRLFCIAAFHHLPGKIERRKAVHEMHRVLREDGVLILTVWNLFQWKYAGALLRGLFSFLLRPGWRYAWNDVWIRWGPKSGGIRRYYHAFLPGELRRYFSEDDWRIEEFYFTRKGNRVSFYRSFNIVLIARKRSDPHFRGSV